MKVAIVRPPPVVQPEPTVTLELTEREAIILRAYLDGIGGDGEAATVVRNARNAILSVVNNTVGFHDVFRLLSDGIVPLAPKVTLK